MMDAARNRALVAKAIEADPTSTQKNVDASALAASSACPRRSHVHRALRHSQIPRGMVSR